MRAGLYFCDNGAVYCHDHLGMSAQMTGFDISGQEIDRVTERDVKEEAAGANGYAWTIKCETCGKELNKCT